MGDEAMADWAEHKAATRRLREQRRQRADNEFRAAAALADGANLRLIRKTDAHYQLTPQAGGWLLNLYPGNCRVWPDPNRPEAPFLGPGHWTLIEAVERAIAAEETP